MVQHDYRMDVGNDWLLLESYRDELDKPRHIRIGRRYPLGYFIGCNDTPFREWDILQLRNYNDSVLHFQKSTLLCVITEKRFEEKSDIGEDYYLYFVGVAVGRGVPDHFYVGRGRWRNNIPIYTSGFVVWYCGTVIGILSISCTYRFHNTCISTNSSQV